MTVHHHCIVHVCKRVEPIFQESLLSVNATDVEKYEQQKRDHERIEKRLNEFREISSASREDVERLENVVDDQRIGLKEDVNPLETVFTHGIALGEIEKTTTLKDCEE